MAVNLEFKQSSWWTKVFSWQSLIVALGCVFVLFNLLKFIPEDLSKKENEEKSPETMEQVVENHLDVKPDQLLNLDANVILPPPPAEEKVESVQVEEKANNEAVKPTKQLQVVSTSKKKRDSTESLSKSKEKQLNLAEQLLKQKQHLAAGKKALTLLESGEGPNILIKWPDNASERTWVRDRLYGCGVKLGTFEGNRLTAVESHRGRLSGFMRLVDGSDLDHHEIQRLSRLRGSAEYVRLFPRYLDVSLLAGLDAVAPGALKGAKQISMRYRRSGGELVVSDVVVDNKNFDGNISLLPGKKCSV